MKARIGKKVFTFRALSPDEFVQVQDLIGDGSSEKTGTAFRLACQSAVIEQDGMSCTARDLNEALKVSPGAIVKVGGRLYADAMKDSEILGEE